MTFKRVLQNMLVASTLAVGIQNALGTCSGTTYTTSQAGDWNVAATWGGAGVPGANDVAVITHNVNVTANASACKITVAASTLLQIQSGKQLTIGGDDPSTVSGTVQIDSAVLEIQANTVTFANGSLLSMTGDDPLLKVDGTDGVYFLDGSELDANGEDSNPAVIGGGGSAKFESASSVNVFINSGGDFGSFELKLDTGTTMHGSFTMLSGGGTVEFFNKGLVFADVSSDKIDFAASLDVIADTTSSGACPADPRWEAASGSTLQFDGTGYTLVGNFKIDGTLTGLSPSHECP